MQQTSPVSSRYVPQIQNDNAATREAQVNRVAINALNVLSAVLFTGSLGCVIAGLLIPGIGLLIAGMVALILRFANDPSAFVVPMENRPTATNNSTQRPAPTLAPTTSNSQLSLASLAGGDSKLQEEVQKLNSLRLFANEPTLSNYFSLLPASRYLVAGRYTYPITWGWCISTSYQLMEKFELDFRSGISSSSLNQAAQEAIVLQEKILFAEILLKTLKRNGNIEVLANAKPQIFNEINEFLKKGYGTGFGNDILRTYPNTQRTSEIIKTIIHLWNDAYYDLDWYNNTHSQN